MESTVEEPAPQGIKYWCEDETRLGLKTRESRRITALGIKPIGQVQWNFKAYYLYGAIAPQTGETFFLEFSHLDGDCFQIFLNELSQAFPDNLNVVQVDNGRFHHSSKLEIPENILLIFQPPYSPELNPIERVWQFLKQQLNWEIYQNLESLKERVGAIIEDLSPEIIRSLTGWDYILEALRIVA